MIYVSAICSVGYSVQCEIYGVLMNNDDIQ